MRRRRTIVRIIGKTARWVLVAFVLLAGLWFVANRFLDESPNADRSAFLVSSDDEIPDQQNIAVGMLGLTAPLDASFIEHGSTIAEAYRNNVPFEQIETMIRGPRALLPTVDSNQVWCWDDPYGPTYGDCLPFEEAPRILRENATLLDRYRFLHRLTEYSNLYGYFNRETLIVLKLANAEIYVHLENGEYDTAYQKWRDQLRFSKAVLRGADTWVGKAVGLVTFGFTLPLLDSIIAENPELARVHKTELRTLLQFEGIDAFNPEGIMRAEYSILKQSLETPPPETEEWSRDRLLWLTYYLGQEQRILNRYLIFSQDYVKALRKPWSQIDEEMSRLEEKHVFPSLWDTVIDPFGALFLAVYFNGQLKARELLTSMHADIGRLRLAALFVRIVNEGVEDPAISDYLKSAGSPYHDPFALAPMKWDPEKRRIYFPDPQNQCAVYGSFLLPERSTRKSLRGSRADSSLC